MRFTFTIVSDSARRLDGSYEAEDTGEGLALRRKGELAETIPLGTPTNAHGTVVSCEAGEQTIAAKVSRLGHYSTALADDLAAYLRGELPALDPAATRVEGYLLALALLPLGAPLLTVGGAIPAGLAAALTVAGFGLASRDELSVGLRTGLLLGLAAAGYAATYALLTSLGA